LIQWIIEKEDVLIFKYTKSKIIKKMEKSIVKEIMKNQDKIAIGPMSIK